MSVQPFREYTPEPPQHERWLNIYQPMIDLAQRLTNAPFVPDGMRGDAGAVFSVILAGHGMGLHPIAALQSITLIKGKPYIDTEVYLGLAYNAGHTIQWGECTDKRATVRVVRGDGRGSAEVTYTIGQATLAGYTNKDNWRRMPGEMLKARAVRTALKMVAPDLLLGIEPADSEPQEGGSQSSGGVSVVQLAAPTPVDNPTVQLEAAPAPTPYDAASAPVAAPYDAASAPVDPPVAAPESHAEPDLLTPAQMRKIGAQIGELERVDGKRLDRAERREFIATLAGLDQLASAKDLTKDQASTVIEALDAAIRATPAVTDSDETEGQP